MTKSARIQEVIARTLADGLPHTVQEIKSFLEQEGVFDYTEGQFSGSINTLLRNKTIKKVIKTKSINKSGFLFEKIIITKKTAINIDTNGPRDPLIKIYRQVNAN